MANVLERKKLRYTGKPQPSIGEYSTKTDQFMYPYLPGDRLIDSVNLAIYLEKPLLLKGEPGCGKTKLASAVAYELNLPLETWFIKSTSRAQDGLYVYDSIRRLRDAQLVATDKKNIEDAFDAFDAPETYVRWGPLGKAFQNDLPTILLIDEIDKADIDFPNDLLLELDERRFIVEETGQKIQARTSPIVFITSNDEKDLPDAFLRRCLFHYIEFPDREQLERILSSRFSEASVAMVNKATTRFLELRESIQRESSKLSKNVSTSELIDWFEALGQLPEEEALSKMDGELPYLGVLLKDWEAQVRYLRRAKKSYA